MTEENNQKMTTRTREWNEKNLDRLYITVPKGMKSRIEAHADEHGETINGMVNRLLQREIGISDSEWKAQKDRDE